MLRHTRKIKELYEDIQRRIFKMIPEKWDSLYLYASVMEGQKETGEMFFYYIPKGIFKKKPVNVYEIPSKFNIDESEYLKLVDNLYAKIKELRQEFKKLELGETWSNVTIIIHNARFMVEYDYEDLKDKMDFHFNTAISEIKTCSEGYELVTEKGDVARCQYLIAAPGRSGAEWFANQCKNLGIKLINNQVDIGVRVELPARVFEHITDVVYESKLVYRTKQYGDSVRTFCMNPYGHVVAENVEGINTVNGHSYSDASLRSENTNFALLVSNRFTEPFDEPYRYGKHIASLSNMLAGGVLVQRFGDLVKGVRTNEHRLSQSFVKPTLTAAVPGDLSLALPKRQLDDIIEMIYALDKVAPGTANYDTLLYGAEVKFYSSRLELSHELETKLPGFFAIGDGAGTTRGLAQAGASGIKAARAVLARL